MSKDKEPKPIDTYYALFLPGDQHGSGTFAGGSPDEPIDSLEKVEENIQTVFLFSTQSKDPPAEPVAFKGKPRGLAVRLGRPFRLP